MPDISMCSNEQCTLREDCYRFKAKPNEFRQSYANFKQKDGDCEYFIKNNQQDDRKTGRGVV